MEEEGEGKKAEEVTSKKKIASSCDVAALKKCLEENKGDQSKLCVCVIKLDIHLKMSSCFCHYQNQIEKTTQNTQHSKEVQEITLNRKRGDMNLKA
ncbi:unnamed protein product [Cochlearia groenlandica]